MRKLDGMEMMAIRMALRVEAEKLKDYLSRTSDNGNRAGYKVRYERVENLLAIFKPGTTVTVGV